MDWKIISLEKFKHMTGESPVIEGGIGMRSKSSSNPTKICKVEYFQKLK